MNTKKDSVRAIRLSSKELESIEEFLKNNEILNFSSLVRMAVADFIANSEIRIERKRKSERLPKVNR